MTARLFLPYTHGLWSGGAAAAAEVAVRPAAACGGDIAVVGRGPGSSGSGPAAAALLWESTL